MASPIVRRSATLGGSLLCENRCSFYNQSEWWRDAVGNCLKCDGDVCIATGGRKACFSKLASDTAPVLIAMEAQLEVVTAEGIQTIPLESIYTGDGVDPRNLPPTALIRESADRARRRGPQAHHRRRATQRRPSRAHHQGREEGASSTTIRIHGFTGKK
ncbi:MAG: FAD binding domain-containing protein [Flavobacteriales bacterium]|nr:MAG: FAD binding domain-containing protein [Flavobacteriales bacterium]